jgi:hypothetical protein
MKPSRAMIPGEILCALFALSLAWSGGLSWPFDHGPLYRILAKGDQNVIWLLLMGTPSSALVVLSVREWIYGQKWNGRTVSISCYWRGKTVALMGISWLYAVYLIGQLTVGISGLLVQSVCAAVFCGWSYVENRRVRREIHKKYLAS